MNEIAKEQVEVVNKINAIDNRTILNLIRQFTEKKYDEVETTILEIAYLFLDNGNEQLYDYVLALLGEVPTFVPMEVTDE